MTILFTIIHVLVCVFLVIVVLLQSGKAADLAGAFGGMGSQTAFGPRGAATVLSKATTIAAGLFMVTSLTLSILATRGAGGTGSVLERAGQPAATQQQGGAAAPTGVQQGQPVIPTNPNAQPTVEFVNEKGEVVEKRAIDLNSAPRVDPNNPTAPAQPQQSAPAPAKK